MYQLIFVSINICINLLKKATSKYGLKKAAVFDSIQTLQCSVALGRSPMIMT